HLKQRSSIGICHVRNVIFDEFGESHLWHRFAVKCTPSLPFVRYWTRISGNMSLAARPRRGASLVLSGGFWPAVIIERSPKARIGHKHSRLRHLEIIHILCE